MILMQQHRSNMRTIPDQQARGGLYRRLRRPVKAKACGKLGSGVLAGGTGPGGEILLALTQALEELVALAAAADSSRNERKAQ